MYDISELVSKIWSLIYPVLPGIAAKKIKEIGEYTVEKIWETISQKFDTRPAAKESLDDLLKAPEDEDLQVQFRAQLKKSIQEDMSFATELERLLKSVISENQVQNQGDGVIAMGPKSKAVGKGGVSIEGDVKGIVNTGKIINK